MYFFSRLHPNLPCRGIAADVRNPEQVEKAVGKAIELFGKVDILVNGAGEESNSFLRVSVFSF